MRSRPDESLPARRPQSWRARGSTAMSRALKGTRFARRIVSRREVAVTMWAEPAVREVKMYRAGSSMRSAGTFAAMAREMGSRRAIEKAEEEEE